MDDLRLISHRLENRVADSTFFIMIFNHNDPAACLFCSRKNAFSIDRLHRIRINDANCDAFRFKLRRRFERFARIH